jgi:hypothetical protein
MVTMAGGVVQVIEHLPGKNKAPSTTQINK